MAESASLTRLTVGACRDDESRLFTRGMEASAGGPPTAGMMVITASRGGMFRETAAMSKAYAEARAEHGDGELLDEIVAAKPQVDHTRYHSAEELRDNGLRHIRDAVALVDSKAIAQERDDYRRFVVTLAGKVASVHREGGQSVSQPSIHPADHSSPRRVARWEGGVPCRAG